MNQSPRYSAPGIPKFSPVPPIRNSPGRLTFSQDEEANTNSLPRSFLTDLQKVMNKKWKVAEKCRTEVATTPHEVLGFRDEPIQQLGQPGMYSQNSAIGAWVLDSQQYTEDDVTDGHGAYDQYSVYSTYNNSQVMPQYSAQPNHGYAPQTNNSYHHHQHPNNGYPDNSGQIHPDQYNTTSVYQQYGDEYGHDSQYADISHYRGGPEGHYAGSDGQRPVVLVEPEPNYVDPSRMRANKGKRPPPPPRRSENTQLTAGY